MKTLKLTLSLVVLVGLLTGCTSVRVATDYDRMADFDQYKTFAFYKPGIDRANISDLDKKRILRSIQNELVNRGYQKSSNPDMLISIFTSERDRVTVYNNAGWGWGWGWGWGPGWGPGWGGAYGSTVSTNTEGSLYIDLIDTKRKELVWQGKGTGDLITNGDITKKEERIALFVNEILGEFPPPIKAETAGN
ncbi:DUF4136 domain-containing protein [Robertkochia marina]|uniref:DUF4136 domain-containing protein n=1 Tax=Robertkochia marina TaxID=1227945 RepID=A0A4S3M3Q8_9FLAO|nr:DUF4136 domain-containing protein [Robertkochia marina]THD68767.1 DUF4136 domain-containing protein [Robertkochia marina]TRZ43838.1 DUF4136 domain-containing protein [Robertkochia marina]